MSQQIEIERVQTGVRLEERLLEALNAIAKKNKANLGDLIEEMVLHAFDGSGACAFKNPAALQPLLKEYRIDYGVHSNYNFSGDKDGAMSGPGRSGEISIRRIQSGFKLEKRLLKVLKGIAEYGDSTLGQVIEEIALHQLVGGDAYMPCYIAKVVEPLKQIYGLDYQTHDNGNFVET